ncbi:type II/IV secretion system ATPase subunit [Halobaculum gomorrense]|uniref:Type IV secretory pathway ATPase VirB11/Archaellum biosynthesis ATPase n=1 Tax=Halobaculum gomorrense TaxID=43928 RepID=A0A1M5JJQ3_9EURY|nr:type II/IV secretion system ATPase subunit [Halobaculum gomorrense]SHG40787.1 Type IV secretory pathway ATPase VirB11/Archaellum biosynthesis ATPase [Halobaculum gomorrense]
MTVETGDLPTVPAPEPPGSADAWYAPDVRAQYELYPGVVATVRERRGAAGSEFRYETREPSLGAAGERAVGAVANRFDAGQHRRPLTRAGAVERADDGFEPKYERAIDRLIDATPALRRRVDYHTLREFRLLGRVTPLALDDRVEVADVTGEDGRVVVHTSDFAPAVTDVPVNALYVGRVASERLRTYEVSFEGFAVEVAVYRDRLLGDDRFATKYAVREPPLLPGDEELIAECKERVWETTATEVVEDRAAFVRERARRFLARRLTARDTRAWVDATGYRVRSALAEYDLAVPPVDSRYAPDRLADLVYYVLRDYVGQGVLTIPLRDSHLEDVEANRVGERVKVVPRSGLGAEGRVPTNLAFDSEAAFVNVVTQLAALDGTELNASNPSAKVNVDLDGVPDTIRCAVALPVISTDGPHLSVRKQSADPHTPVDLVNSGTLPTELVTLLWQLYEHRGVVLFSGATGAGKTTLMNAHTPFIPFDARPVSIDEGSREVVLPHETGISLTTRDHENEFKRVTMADLMTETNYLNPDIEVIAEVNTPASFETFGESLNTGHGVLGTTHADDVDALVNRVIEQGLPPYLLGEIDLVVFPHNADGDRYVGEAIEIGPAGAFDDCTGANGVIEKDGTAIGWNGVFDRDPSGEFAFAYDHPELGDATRRLDHRVFHGIAARTDRTVEAVEAEFHRKHRYVRYLVREGVTDIEETFDFLADLRTDEAATVERVRRETAARASDERGGTRSPGSAAGTAPDSGSEVHRSE